MIEEALRPGARSTGRCQSRSEASIIRWFGTPARRSRPRDAERVGFVLYGRAVAASRDPAFYTEPPEGLAVADTLDGRFDMICLHVALLSRRLIAGTRVAGASDAGAVLAQAVFDAMFTDMDQCLREGGVGDPGVPRRVRAMWEAYHGRARAYGGALDDADRAALSAAMLRNIWRGRDGAGPQAERLAAWAMRQDAALAAQPETELTAGRPRFLAAGDIRRGAGER